MRVAVLAFLIALSPFAARAFDGCDKFIKYDKSTLSSTLSSQMTYLNSISSEEYESDDEGIKTKAQFPIQGIMVGGEGNWEKFTEKRSALNAMTNWTLDLQSSSQVSQNYVSAGSWSAVIECLKSRNNGLFISPQNSDGSQIPVVVIYRGPTSASNSIDLTWTVIGGTVGRRIDRIGRGDEAVALINREARRDLSIIVAGGGLRSNQIYIRTPPEINTIADPVTWTPWVRGPVRPNQFHIGYNEDANKGLPSTVTCQHHSIISGRHGSTEIAEEEHFGRTVYAFAFTRQFGDYHVWEATANGRKINGVTGKVMEFLANDITIYCR